jgi:hypothetical protein
LGQLPKKFLKCYPLTEQYYTHRFELLHTPLCILTEFHHVWPSKQKVTPPPHVTPFGKLSQLFCPHFGILSQLWDFFSRLNPLYFGIFSPASTLCPNDSISCHFALPNVLSSDPLPPFTPHTHTHKVRHHLGFFGIWGQNFLMGWDKIPNGVRGSKPGWLHLVGPWLCSSSGVTKHYHVVVQNKRCASRMLAQLISRLAFSEINFSAAN